MAKIPPFLEIADSGAENGRRFIPGHPDTKAKRISKGIAALAKHVADSDNAIGEFCDAFRLESETSAEKSAKLTDGKIRSISRCCDILDRFGTDDSDRAATALELFLQWYGKERVVVAESEGLPSKGARSAVAYLKLQCAESFGLPLWGKMAETFAIGQLIAEFEKIGEEVEA